ncbi:dTDP-4-dehydrorhamnose 3,5-epimerase [PVC group bacterium (ex Bugula neritina AB1)]|nr:dTDP-4-dehydrorhamnose 3,5-epimerase [PVC group bacterium (ex Bugula neritina AB1)]
MDFISTPFNGLLILKYNVHRDERGFFVELFNENNFKSKVFDVCFKQDNLSESGYGTLRGMHFQKDPYAQGKLVTVLEGKVFDAVVDLRLGEPTFGQYFSYVLDANNHEALYVPPGFAHGFCVLSEKAKFFYKCTEVFHPESKQNLFWNDPDVGIEWPSDFVPTQISQEDQNAPSFKDLF